MVWPGKYNEDGTLRETPRVNLPFQVIETFNESRATHQARDTATMTLFDFYEAEEGDTFDEGWKNKLIWGDNLIVMGSLLEQFAGRIDLIYIDPPFATGADFTFDAQVGETGPSLVKELYGAAPIAGTSYLHGKKGNAMVHIGSVDAPVTIDEVNTALDECATLRQDELHVLGWEWEMGLVGPNTDLRKGGLMHDVARRKGVRLLLLQIPREVMEEREADDGSVRFFELAYLKARIDKVDWLTVKVTLEDFVMPNTDLIPDDVRTKIDKWSDYIDYWAVDWDFQSDTFMQGWVTYRTSQDRTLLLTSDSHTYKDPGRYMVLIKIVDIFGNDTSQAFSVQVR